MISIQISARLDEDLTVGDLRQLVEAATDDDEQVFIEYAENDSEMPYALTVFAPPTARIVDASMSPTLWRKSGGQ